MIDPTALPKKLPANSAILFAPDEPSFVAAANSEPIVLSKAAGRAFMAVKALSVKTPL
jgi:hypothetical protein